MKHLILLFPLTILSIYWGAVQKSCFTPSGALLGAWILFLGAHWLIAPDYILCYHAILLIMAFLIAFFIGEIVGQYIFLKNKTTWVRSRSIEGSKNLIKTKSQLRKIVIIIGSLSIAGSIAYLNIFIGHFGSITNLLTSGWLIREEMRDGAIQVPITVRAIALLGYSGVSLAMVYWIRFGARPFLALPFLGIITMGIAQAARAGTFILLIIIFISSYWRDKQTKHKRIGLRLIKRIFIFLSLIIFIFVLGLMFREQQFSFDSDQFSHLKSFRIYAVGAISSFSAFLDKYDSGTPLTWGRYSFASFAQMIGLHQFGSFGFYDDYLDISQTSNDYTNVYTIFRSLIEDFGIKGSILYMLTLGIITRMAYSCAVEGSLPALSFILGIYAMFVYSPIAPLTQHNSIIISWILPAFILSIITKNKKTYSVLQ